MKIKTTQINLLLLLFIATLGACVKGSSVTVDLPQLVTNDVIIDPTATIAWTGGLITNNVAVSAYGICYSTTNSEPTIADSKTSDNVNVFSYSSKLNGLALNTVYYIRAYATNSVGNTGYGNVIQFKTGSGTPGVYGTVSTVAGSAEGYQNNTGTAALFNRPTSLATDAAGNIYVADSYNSVIRKITPEGVTTTFAGTGTFGYTDGPAASAQFYVPSGLVVDATGNIFVADLGNNIIRKITPDGVVSTFAGNGSSGSADGTANAATFSGPAGIALGTNGNFYVTDSNNNLIRQVTPAGVVTTVAGNHVGSYINGIGTAASFNKPTGIAFDAAGNMYVAEAANNAIRKITKDYTVTTFAGGVDTAALKLGSPQDLKVDANNNVYITDAGGRILKISKDRIVTTLAGKTATTGTTDGDGSTALFNGPKGIALDPQGNIIIADYNNNRIRKVVQ
jgi:sugar lactone lactonase YvrE